MFCTLVKNKMFKEFDCRDLFPDTPCCEERELERFCFMKNDPTQVGAVLRVEVRSCCKHAHQAKRIPVEFYIEHHRPYVVATQEAKVFTRKVRTKGGDDDDWLW